MFCTLTLPHLHADHRLKLLRTLGLRGGSVDVGAASLGWWIVLCLVCCCCCVAAAAADSDAAAKAGCAWQRLEGDDNDNDDDDDAAIDGGIVSGARTPLRSPSGHRWSSCASSTRPSPAASGHPIWGD